MSNEEWRPVTGYEASYQVSNLGRVKNRHDRVLATVVNRCGYEQLNLWENSKSRTFLVHRLVAQAFIPNSEPDVRWQINHKNGIKTDNTVNNLEWVTMSENMLHSYRQLGRRAPKFWEGKFGANHNTAMPVDQIKNGKVIKRWPSQQDAVRAGYNAGKISECVNGFRPRHQGCEWRRAA